MSSFSFGTFSFLPLFLLFILTQTEAGDASGETGGRSGMIPSHQNYARIALESFTEKIFFFKKKKLLENFLLSSTVILSKM